MISNFFIAISFFEFITITITTGDGQGNGNDNGLDKLR